jgi:acetyl esterase/lipase
MKMIQNANRKAPVVSISHANGNTTSLFRRVGRMLHADMKELRPMKAIVLLLMTILPSFASCSSGNENEDSTPTETTQQPNGNRDNDNTDTTKMNDNTSATTDSFTVNSTVGEVIADSAFGDFGRLLFPVDRNVSNDMTLAEVSTSNVYVWYNYIRPAMTVDIINTLKRRAQSGEKIFYRFYSDDEIRQDSEKAYTGLFFFRGTSGAPFAVCNAGGGFMYVGAMHDSFPHALSLSRMGYNAFGIIYRPDTPYEDLARALAFIHDHASELGVNPDGYSLWGGSAGARMAATLGNAGYLRQLTGRTDIPQAAAVIMQYTGYSEVSSDDAPTYACVGTSDGIASWRTMQNRLQRLSALGIPTEFHSYQGLPHGFGLGTGTVAEGWINDAVRFWQQQL